MDHPHSRRRLHNDGGDELEVSSGARLVAIQL